MSHNIQLVRHTLRTAGLRVREQDVEALSRWTAERLRKLALPRIEQYGQLLAEDSAAGRRERELLTVQFSTGESYFFRDQGQFDLLAATILSSPTSNACWACLPEKRPAAPQPRRGCIRAREPMDQTYLIFGHRGARYGLDVRAVREIVWLPALTPILAVADVIEAMSSHRPYRAGRGLDAALAQIRQEAGTKLDPQVVDACERVFREQGFSFGKA